MIRSWTREQFDSTTNWRKKPQCKRWDKFHRHPSHLKDWRHQCHKIRPTTKMVVICLIKLQGFQTVSSRGTNDSNAFFSWEKGKSSHIYIQWHVTKWCLASIYHDKSVKDDTSLDEFKFKSHPIRNYRAMGYFKDLLKQFLKKKFSIVVMLNALKQISSIEYHSVMKATAFFEQDNRITLANWS